MTKEIEQAISKIVEDREDFLDFDLGDKIKVYYTELRRNQDMKYVAQTMDMPELASGDYDHWWDAYRPSGFADPLTVLRDDIPEEAIRQEVKPILIIAEGGRIFEESLIGYVLGDRAWVDDADYEDLFL